MKYQVLVERTERKQIWIDVEAKDEYTAKEQALDESYGIDIDDWEYSDCNYEVPIVNVVKPEPKPKPIPLTYEEIVALIRKDVYSYPVESLQGRLEMHQKYGYMNSPSDNIERDFIKERITSLGI